MVFYKDENNKIYGIEAEYYNFLLPPGCVIITETEVATILSPTASVQLESSRIALKSIRDTALSELTHDFGDGRIMQVRPSDAGNIQIAIGIGVDQEWVMADNTVATVTPTELQTAFDEGVQGATEIWFDYTTSLKSL